MSELTRDSVLLTRKFTKIHLGTLIDNYGVELLVKMIPSVYRFNHENDYFEIVGLRNRKNGRPFHHINQKTGHLKLKYKGKDLRQTLIYELQTLKRYNPLPTFIRCVCILQYHCKKMYMKKEKNCIYIQKNVRRFITRIAKEKAQRMIREDIDFLVDSITLDSLHDPCIICPDFENGNYIIYNRSTIRKMEKVSRIPIFSYYNELTQNEETMYRYVVERDNYCNTIYKSPYTRNEFIMEDVLSLKDNLVFKFGQLLTISQNRMKCDKEV